MVVEMFMMMLKTWYMQSPSSAIDGLNISLILFSKIISLGKDIHDDNVANDDNEDNCDNFYL